MDTHDRFTSGIANSESEQHLEQLRIRTEECRLLHLEIEQLRSRVAFFEQHPTLQKGIQGETLIAEIVAGTITPTHSPFDIVLPHSGMRIEVKLSSLNVAVKGRKSPTKRWTWVNLLGVTGRKEYDYLILIGETDGRFASFYRDPASPFVMFVVPYVRIPEILAHSDPKGAIQISTHPNRQKDPRSVRLFEEFQVSRNELATMFLFS